MGQRRYHQLSQASTEVRRHYAQSAYLYSYIYLHIPYHMQIIDASTKLAGQLTNKHTRLI